MGLNLKQSKTCITHTLNEHEGYVGFDFLGFNIRQFKTGRHITCRGYRTVIKPSKDAQQRHPAEMAEVIQQYRGAPQTALIAKLNPKVRGWTTYYRSCSSQRVMPRMGHLLYKKLRSWAKWRHPRKAGYRRYRRYRPRHRGRVLFSNGEISLVRYIDVKRERHVKVTGDKSPFDGDWLYWATRLGREPTRPQRVVVLAEKTTRQMPTVRATLSGRGHHGGSSHRPKQDEQCAGESDTTPRSLSRRSPSQMVLMTRAYRLRSRVR